MFAKAASAHLIGIDGVAVDVEADAASVGLPSFSVVGLAEGAIKESKERVKAALKNLGYSIFARPITVNLAPADFKKEGTHFDLPIALALLAATDNLPSDKLGRCLILGELSLDGRLRGVAGVLSMAEAAAKNGLEGVIVPKENAEEASLIEGVEVYPFDCLGETVAFLKGDKICEPYKRSDCDLIENVRSYGCDFAEIKGQLLARRAAEIAVSGMHNMILIGSPGSGKTMIARRIPTIMPPMTGREALQTTKIHSAAGRLLKKGRLISSRPFISPHHTASNIALVGGGTKARPGQVSIASGGVLFLDEMLEFGRGALEVLRQPMEDREVTVARAGRTVTYPADFMLIGAMNPCPCGYYGDKKRECVCAPYAIERYRSRLSGPMLDRIDLHVYVPSVDYSSLSEEKSGESSEDIRRRVTAVHSVQRKRFEDETINFNSQMSEKHMSEFCALSGECSRILGNAAENLNLSARAYSKIVKTARTIADMSEESNISPRHLLEALQFRAYEGR